MFGFTHLTIRFVDRDMFMRYRGGGIGHTYMRAIEEVYENMSRERSHHKERYRKGTQLDKDTPMDVDDTDGADKGEAETAGSRAGQGVQPGGQDETSVSATNADRAATPTGDTLYGNGDDDDDDDSDDDDYAPDSDLCSSEISDSDNLDSDESCGDNEPYGFGDL